MLRPRGLRPLLPVMAAAALLPTGCGGGDSTPATSSAPVEMPATTTAAGSGDDGPSADGRVRTPKPPPCPAATANCERASGQVAYVQRVDPDGDGDAHFVLISDESISAPGISVIDVEASLRPEPLPRRGDFAAASGPVYRGSYGQRQIQAIAVRVRYADRGDADRSP